MTARTSSLWTIAIYVGPLVLCSIFKYLVGHSIGTVVLIYSVLGAVVVGLLWGAVLRRKFGLALAIPGGAVAGIGLGLLLINYFMLLTSLFGIKDYSEI